MTKISGLPSGGRSRRKAILPPSGDHAGSISRVSVLVTCVRSPVRRSMIHRSVLPPCRGSGTAILVPSGDQAGREPRSTLVRDLPCAAAVRGGDHQLPVVVVGA